MDCNSVPFTLRVKCALQRESTQVLNGQFKTQTENFISHFCLTSLNQKLTGAQMPLANQRYALAQSTRY